MPEGQWKRYLEFSHDIDLSLVRPDNWAGNKRPLHVNMIYLAALPKTFVRNASITVRGRKIGISIPTAAYPAWLDTTFLNHDYTMAWAMAVHALPTADGSEFRNPGGKLLLAHLEWSLGKTNDMVDPQAPYHFDLRHFNAIVGDMAAVNAGSGERVALLGRLDRQRRFIP